MADPQWCVKQSERIGASSHALIRRLFVDRVLDNLRAAQGVFAEWGDAFPANKVLGAATLDRLRHCAVSGAEIGLVCLAG